MAIDNDLTALVPDPPPPRPAGREAAIAEALRRFDGEPAARPSAPRAPASPGWARPQVALLASALLVVMLSVPIWWTERDRIDPSAPPAAVVPPRDAEGAPSPQAATAKPDPAAPSAAPSTEPAPSAAPAALEANLNKLPQYAPALAPSAVADAPDSGDTSLSQRERGGETPATAVRSPPPPPPPPAPPPPRAARQSAAEAADDEQGAQIMVTGSRVAAGGDEARAPVPAAVDAAPLDGEWNACTLDDPRRNPTRCRSSAQVSEGLALAWQGDLDRAIRSFDRAIGAESDLALAYLNRGLAYRQKGDLARALSDLNRAVARDRTGARAYYHRSRLYHARGDEARAAADAERAVELDPDYAAVLR